jgi:hypothetical protein
MRGAKLRRPKVAPALRQWPAVIANPLPDVRYVNEPVGIRVFFFQGECPAATHIRVRNPAGTAVDFQWEPAAHTLTESSMGMWPDGSLRHGTLWLVVPSLAPGATLTYTVELHDSAQSYSPTQLVTHTVTDASNEKFDTAAVSLNFQSTVGWMPQSFIDKATSGEMLATATGLTMRIRATLAGGEKLSSTGAHITGSAKARIGTSNTGYGVAYQEFEASWTWADAPWNTRVRTRLWANGRVTMQAYTVATNSSASEQKYLVLNFSANNTSIITNTGDNEKGRKLWEYADRRFLCGFRYLTTNYEVKTTETHSTNWSTSVAANRMFGGWLGTTTIATGAYWFQGAYMTLYAFGDVENEWKRAMNPVLTTAARWGVGETKGFARGLTLRYIEAWLPISTDTDKKGLEGGMRCVLGRLTGAAYPPASALTKYQEYTTSVGITPSSGSSYHSVWNAGQGLNFIGKNGHALSIIYDEAVRQGDAASAATARAYMEALADFVVLAEVTSGGSGQMLLSGLSEDNWNAEGTAMGLLAQKLAHWPNATQVACYNRIAARFASGYFCGPTRMGYNLQTPGALPHDSIKIPRSTYEAYQTFEFYRAHAMYPTSVQLPSPRHYLYEMTNAAFMCEERLYQGQVTRRGLSNSLFHWVLPLGIFGNASDWNAIALICRLVDQQVIPKNGQTHPMHGYSGTDVTLLNVMGDIRAPAEALWLLDAA